ncbi:ribonuclease H2 subunit B isoform X1 [Dermacentor andersoni]|uniref:ribonuclease H2 subunit B isoform X1 n=1 Tax=Dermacentor andersoni TaxID=34620 RepID=UPI0021550DF2|nr:ribonuclease H2 subunit B-like isoform X1 [Dermacentor andersoni]
MPRQRNGDGTTSESSKEPLRFFVLPNAYAAEDEQTHNIVPLPHPKTEASSLYLKADSGEYLELVKFKEKRGSWIVDDFVEPDGSLYVATPMDPLFFAVALLQKSDKFRPLEDFVEDNLYPHLVNVIRSCSSRMRHIADVKELGEDRVYRYNESKCLAWLTKKVKAVATALESADIQVGAACISAALVRSKRDTRPTSEDYMVTAHSIVADYVPPTLGSLLKTSLGLGKKPAAEKKAEAPSSPPPKKQKTEQVEPLEDYSQGTPKNGLLKSAKTPKLTASQKKLQKADKTGMKSISSFFAKK